VRRGTRNACEMRVTLVHEYTVISEYFGTKGDSKENLVLKNIGLRFAKNLLQFSKSLADRRNHFKCQLLVTSAT